MIRRLKLALGADYSSKLEAAPVSKAFRSRRQPDGQVEALLSATKRRGLSFARSQASSRRSSHPEAVKSRPERRR
ncbi:hypothetical protein [Bradyrhizobium sp. USDA 4473]